MTTPQARSTAKPWQVVTVFLLSVIAQLFMLGLGIAFIMSEEPLISVFTLTGWCLLGSTYLVVALIVLGVTSRWTRTEGQRPTRLELSRPARMLSYLGTFFASLIGLLSAIQVLTLRNDPQFGTAFDLVGVWAMLLSWGFLHWGFAQMYQQQYYTIDPAPMRFPATPSPGAVDFVYFAFTLGTSFAASDVEVLNTRVRWRVVWHSVLSFFFNGLIIVLALNTILSTGQSGS